MMDIYTAIRMGLCQSTSNFLGNTYRSQRKRFIRSLGFHLKGFCTVQVVPDILFYCFVYGIQILFTRTASAKTDKAKNTAASFPCTLQVSFLIHRFHINSRLHNVYIKIAVCLHAAAHILTQSAFKLALIGTL